MIPNGLLHIVVAPPSTLYHPYLIISKEMQLSSGGTAEPAQRRRVAVGGRSQEQLDGHSVFHTLLGQLLVRRVDRLQ